MVNIRPFGENMKKMIILFMIFLSKGNLRAEESWSKKELDQFCNETHVVWNLALWTENYLEKVPEPKVKGFPLIEGTMNENGLTIHCKLIYEAEPRACNLGATRTIEIKYPHMTIINDIHNDHTDCRNGT